MRNKYNARRVTMDGYTFDSQAEAARYAELKLLQAAGAIAALEVHPRFELQPAFTDRAGQQWRPIHYEADFAYLEDGQRVIEDVKGAETQVFRLKRKMFLRCYPALDLRIIRAH